jgi:hypothetical protein
MKLKSPTPFLPFSPAIIFAGKENSNSGTLHPPAPRALGSYSLKFSASVVGEDSASRPGVFPTPVFTMPEAQACRSTNPSFKMIRLKLNALQYDYINTEASFGYSSMACRQSKGHIRATSCAPASPAKVVSLLVVTA